MAQIFSITTGSSIGAITGVIVGDATLDAKVGALRELDSNPTGTVEDTRIGTPSERTLTTNFAFSAGNAASILALSLADGATDVEVVAGTLSLEGKVTHWQVKAVKDDWWVGTVTVVKKGADAI